MLRAPAASVQDVSRSTGKVAAALKLVTAGLSPTMAARQLGLGSTVYQEVGRAGIQRGA